METDRCRNLFYIQWRRDVHMLRPVHSISNVINCPLLVPVFLGIIVSDRITHFRFLTHGQRNLGDRYLITTSCTWVVIPEQKT